LADVWLPYGATEVCVRIPAENFYGIMEAQDKGGVKDPREEIEGALKNPLGSKRLCDIAKPGDKAALALNIPDAELAKLTVSLIIDEISRAGIKLDDLTVVLTDNPLPPKVSNLHGSIRDEISALGVGVKMHDRFADNSIYIGDAGGGTKIHLNRDFAEASIKIVASILEPNPYTLYNFGGCAVALGLSDTATIEGVLAPALDAENIGEAVFERVMEVLRAVKIAFSVSIVRNVRGEVVKSFAGGAEETFLEAAKIVDSIFKVRVEDRADIVVISAGGAPFDKSLFNACGCIENALKVLKRNGAIVLAAECPEGYGDTDMRRIIEGASGDIDSLRDNLKKSFSVGGFVACRFLRALRKASIFMTSAIPNYYAKSMPDLRVFRAANEAFRRAVDRFERKPKVLAIPHGSLIIPAVGEFETRLVSEEEK